MKTKCKRCHGRKRIKLGKNIIPCPACTHSRKKKKKSYAGEYLESRHTHGNPVTEIKCDNCGKIVRGGKFYTKHDGSTYCSKRCAKAKRNPGFLETAAHLGSIAASASQLISNPKHFDPTKNEMLAYLGRKWSRLVEGWRDEAEVAIYWFAYGSHGGQGSNLYSALSTSPYKPGPMMSGVSSEGEIATDMYYDLVNHFRFGRNPVRSANPPTHITSFDQDSNSYYPNPSDRVPKWNPDDPYSHQLRGERDKFYPNPMPRRRFPRSSTLQFDSERSRYYENPSSRYPLTYAQALHIANLTWTGVYGIDRKTDDGWWAIRLHSPTGPIKWVAPDGETFGDEAGRYARSHSERYEENPPATMPSGGSFNTSASSYRKHYGWTHGKHRGWSHRKKKHPMYGNRGGSKWIQKALAKKSSKGYLHRALGIKEGVKIPFKKLLAAKRQKKNERMHRAAILALRLRKYHKTKKK